MKLGRDWAQGGIGAALATVAVVAIYEGRAHLARSARDVRAEGGEARREAVEDPVSDRQIGRLELPLRGSNAIPKASVSDSAATEGRVAGQLEQVRGKLADVEREKRDLEAQLRTLEGALAQQPERPRGFEPEEFELDREDWKVLAGESRIKYRIPCPLPPERVGKFVEPGLEELGLSPDDHQTLTQAHRRSNARVWAVLQPLCLKIMPGANVDLLGPRTCLDAIERAAMTHDPKAYWAVRRQVGEVHAGMRPPPEMGASRDPLFDVYMALTGEAQLFEADLSESFGPEEAQRIWHTMRCAEAVGVKM